MVITTYKEAGVDIDAGNILVKKIKNLASSTFGPEVITNIGAFSGLFSLNLSNFKEPILVSSCDGVGTKIKLAVLVNRHKGIGIDLVAMCVNDLLCMGATPLFLLDYFATSKIDIKVAKEVISGIAIGCKLANCALLGGETAEMPDIYQKDEYDLAGFCIGIIEKKKIIDGSKIKPKDLIIGISSSGVHSNGFSLVRKIFNQKELVKLSKTLLTPTKIYVKSILNLLKDYSIKGIAHITGGGILENIPRILPPRTKAKINLNSWKIPPIFKKIQKKANISSNEMYRTFNMGIGMVLVVSKNIAENILRRLEDLGEEAYLIGEIEEGRKGISLI
jgi:phosphoribosylformylglycinamidine cyclo-ligase